MTWSVNGIFLSPHPSSPSATINNQMTFPKLYIHFKEMMALKSLKL